LVLPLTIVGMTEASTTRNIGLACGCDESFSEAER